MLTRVQIQSLKRLRYATVPPFSWLSLLQFNKHFRFNLAKFRENSGSKVITLPGLKLGTHYPCSRPVTVNTDSVHRALNGF